VTGATGFIGSHLARLAVRDGHTVAVVVRPGSDPWRLKDVSARITCIECDLADLAGLEARLRRDRPDLCLHMAWRGWSGSLATTEENIRSLAVGAEAMRLVAQLGCA